MFTFHELSILKSWFSNSGFQKQNNLKYAISYTIIYNITNMEYLHII